MFPKEQEESSQKYGSAVAFRTENGLHLLYNEGEKNLTLGETDKPKNYRAAIAGNTVIAIATISESGELSREILYDLKEDKMLLRVQDSSVASEDKVILTLRRKRKEKIGIIHLD